MMSRVVQLRRWPTVAAASLLAAAAAVTLTTRAVPAAMLEKIGAGYEELYNDITLGRASATVEWRSL